VVGSPKNRKLSELLRGGALPPAAALELGISLGVALQRAQAADAASPLPPQRELEPDTIAVASDGTVPTADLGRSYDLGGVESHRSAAYDAPEVLSGFDPSDASHVFSAGALLYEAFLGEPLFASGDLAGARRMISRGLARTLERRDVAGRLDALVTGLGALIVRCLAEEPEDRWVGGAALAAELTRLRGQVIEPPFALERCLAARPIAPPPPSAAVVAPPEPPSFLSGISGLALRSQPGISSDELEKALASNAALPIAEPGETDSARIQRDLRSAVAGSVAVDFDLEERKRKVEQPLLSLEHRTRKAPAEPPQRLTPKPLYKEETFAGAFRWFLTRVSIWGGLPLAALAAWAYFGATPSVTNAQARKVWDALPEVARAGLPEQRQEAIANWWAQRPHSGLLTPAGDALLTALPAAWVDAATAGPSKPEQPLTPGTPAPAGMVTEANAWVGGGFEPPAGLGALKLDIDQADRSVSKVVTAKITARGGASAEALAAARGEAAPATSGPRSADGFTSEAFFLEPGQYDVALTYDEGGDAGVHTGAIKQLRVNAGHTTRVHGVITAPVGFVRLHFGSEEAERSEHVSLAAFGAGDDPVWTGRGGAWLPVPSGTVRVRAVHDDGRHRPTEVWIDDVVVPEDGGKLERRQEVPLGEQLNPTGPGVRVEVVNLGRDVSEQSQVLLYRQGANPAAAPALHRGRGAFYFDAHPGEYDLRVVFEPSSKVLDLRGEAIVQEMVVAEEGVTRLTVDVELPYGTVDLVATRDGEDWSELVRVVLINPGAQFEGSRRVADFEAGEPLPVPVGTWDIHVLAKGPSGLRHETFPSVTLRHGMTWAQRFDLGDASWTAERPTR